MELPLSLENKTYSLDINHRSAVYNFKTVGANFEMKTTIFSYLNNDFPLIIQKQLINEKLIEPEIVTEYEKKDNVNLDVIRKKRRILQHILDTNKAGIVLAETDDSADENKCEFEELNLQYCESN